MFKKSPFVPAVAFACFFLFFSCSSMPPKESHVERIAALINDGNAEKLIDLSQTPFLFDGEIILMGDDVKTLWNNLKKADFRMPRARILKIEPVGETGYKKFSDSMEVRVYFKKYLSKKPVIAQIETDSGRYYLLLSGRKGIYPLIYGFKGPLK